MQRMHNGKIKWFRSYRTHGYDGSTMAQDNMIDENKILHKFGMFTNRKTELKEIVKAKPTVIALVDSISWVAQDIRKVLQSYDSQ